MHGSCTFLQDASNLFYLNLYLIGHDYVGPNLFKESGIHREYSYADFIDIDTNGTSVTPGLNTFIIGFAFGRGY